MRRVLKQLMQLWLLPAFSATAVSEGVDYAVDKSPPKHAADRLWPSGKRFSPAHYISLVAPQAEERS